MKGRCPFELPAVGPAVEQHPNHIETALIGRHPQRRLGVLGDPARVDPGSEKPANLIDQSRFIGIDGREQVALPLAWFAPSHVDFVVFV